MRKKISPGLIGLFVVVGVALSVGAVALLGSGALFRDTTSFVLLFPGSVDGLEIGAPVKFRGVTIGSVSDVRLALEDARTSEPRLPVFIEIDNKKLRSKGAVARPRDPSSVRELVARGLRAQLRTRSLLTGLLFVQLDLRPDIPAHFVLDPGSKYNEIPTIPAPFDLAQSAVERILARLDRTNIDGMVARATEAIEHIDHVASDPSLKAAVESLPQTLASVDRAAERIRELSDDLGARSGPLIASTRETAAAATAALEQARLTLQSVQVLTDPASPLAMQLDIALAEFIDATRSVKRLADYLERNPGAVLRGRAPR